MATLRDRFGCNETYMEDRLHYISAGIRYCRQVLRWDTCEPTESGGISFAAYDPLVNQAVADGVQMVFTISYVPDWAREDMGQDVGGGGYQIATAFRARFQAFCTALALHYKGKVTFWEVFNEVTSTDFYWDTSDYDVVLGLGYDGLKAGSASCKVLLAGLVSPGLEFIPHSETPESFFNRMCSGTPATKWDIAHSHYYGQVSTLPINLGIILGIQSSHGLSARQHWVTESASGAKYGSLVVSPEAAAEDVLKRALAAFFTGAVKFFWWPMSDAYLHSDNPAGLNPTPKCMALCWCPAKVELDLGAPYVSHPRVAHRAFAVMTQKIGLYTALARINAGLYQLAMPTAPETIWVGWGRGRLPMSVLAFFALRKVDAKITDHLGGVRTAHPRDIVLGNAPIYIEFGAPCEG